MLYKLIKNFNLYRGRNMAEKCDSVSEIIMNGFIVLSSSKLEKIKEHYRACKECQRTIALEIEEERSERKGGLDQDEETPVQTRLAVLGLEEL